MKLFEFQAKRIFAQQAILVPRGFIVDDPLGAENIAKKLGGPVALKAQVLVGGRGLAGGVKFARDALEAKKLAEAMFASEIKGEEIKKILVEKKITIESEFYVCVTIDQEASAPIVMASSEGGVEIEAIVAKSPDKIIKKNIDVFKRFSGFEGRSIAKKVGLNGKKTELFSSILKIAYDIFEKYDAQMVEINPLAMTAGGELIAVDAKINIDDRALFRHMDLSDEVYQVNAKPRSGALLREKRAIEVGLTSYFELKGNVGIICDGAGIGMLALDLIEDMGCEPANFCELGGITSSDLMKNAMEVVLSNANVKVLLVNLVGGLNRMDEMAEGLTHFLNENRVSLPIVVRMSGTNEDAGRDILKKHGIDSYDNIYDAVAEVKNLTEKR